MSGPGRNLVSDDAIPEHAADSASEPRAAVDTGRSAPSHTDRAASSHTDSYGVHTWRKRAISPDRMRMRYANPVYVYPFGERALEPSARSVANSAVVT